MNERRKDIAYGGQDALRRLQKVSGRRIDSVVVDDIRIGPGDVYVDDVLVGRTEADTVLRSEWPSDGGDPEC